MGHQHRNEGNDENDLKNAFCRSNEQLQFNLDRIIQKYENMELSGKCSGVEIDLDGYVYYPEDMPRSRLERTLQKLINRNENFGLSAFAAEENSAEIFGKQFKQRLKECKKLDHEFDQRFKSRHPGWRPYTTPRKSRVERTVIKKTVKELTFENPMDYLNYLMRVKQIPADVFKQQEIGYVNRMALPSTELEIFQESARSGKGTRTIRSRSASPCTSTEQRKVPVTAPSSLMIIGDSCIRSRECSPVSSHSPYDDFPTTSQVKAPAPLMFLSDSCNRSRDCSPSTSHFSDNDDFFASMTKLPRKAVSDRNQIEGLYQPSKTDNKAENLFSSTSRRCGKDNISVVWQYKEPPTAAPEEEKVMSPAEKRLNYVQKQDLAVAKREEKYSPISSETTRTSSASLRRMDSKSPPSRSNEVFMTDHSAVTPSSKMMPALTPVGSAESKTSNSGKQSWKRKSSKTPTASKSRRSNVQKKSPETDMRCGTKKTSPPKGANPEATPKIVLSVNLNASNNSTNSRKRKPSRTPRTASKSRITTQKKSPKASRARSTEAALSSKRPKAQVTPKIVMSADSSASSTGNGSRSRKKDLSQFQLTPFTPRLRTNRAQRQPFSSASTPSTTKKRTRGRCQTPHAAATIASPKNESNSFETPKIVESQMSLIPGSKSKKRTPKTPKNVDSQPRANSSFKKREEKVAKTCLMTSVSNANISAEQETSFLTKCSPEIPLHGNIEGSEKKLMPKSAKVAAKAQRKLRSRRKAFTPGVQKLSKKSKRSETISKTKNVKGKRKSSTKNYVILEDAVDQSNKIGDAEDAAPPVHRNSPVPLSSQKWSTSTKLGKRRSDDSDFERVVTPLNGEAAAFDFWNGNVSSVVESYDNNFMCFGKPTTILGFDAGDVRRSCGEDAQQSTLSAFLNCARKYSLSEAESVSVDGAMKEDRRAMAAARNRNRQLISGYYV